MSRGQEGTPRDGILHVRRPQRDEAVALELRSAGRRQRFAALNEPRRRCTSFIATVRSSAREDLLASNRLRLGNELGLPESIDTRPLGKGKRSLS